jgi:hypothetical protein
MSDAVAITADNEIKVDVKLGWFPGLVKVYVDVTCKFRGTEDPDTQDEIIKDMKRYITLIKEKTLTTITTESTHRHLSKDPGYKAPHRPSSYRTGWYGSPSGVGFDARVTVLDREDLSDVFPFDYLETLLETTLFEAVRASKTPTT